MELIVLILQVLKHWQLVMYGTLANPLEPMVTPDTQVSTRDTSTVSQVS